MRDRVLGALVLTLVMVAAGCGETRDLAGGQSIDALKKTKTAAAHVGEQMQERFRQGLREGGATDQQIEEATGEKPPRAAQP